ncbi:MAG: IS1182 family transposase [Phycisphaerae bacterium]|nr:IS1182 family transposase [Phycisphaerae bacterium]
MAGFRRPEVPREQLVLWAQRLDDAIPFDHPVRHVDQLLNSEAFAETFRQWEGEYVLLEGKPPYPPRDLAALYIYGMLVRIRSSRQLEAACYNRIDVLWLLSGQKPDHSTLAGFVGEHGEHLRKLFRDVLYVAGRAGLVKLEHVAVDGTKLEADAGRKSVHDEQYLARQLARIDQQLAEMEAQWDANEKRETDLFGQQVPWTPPSPTDKKRLAKLQRQQERLEEALGEIQRRRHEAAQYSDPKPVASVTDPPARVMRDKEDRLKPNYNAQLAVDTAEGVIVAEDVNDQADDSGQLVPMLEQVEDNCGRLPGEVSADSQYNTGPDLAALEDKQVEGYVSPSGTRGAGSVPSSAAAQAIAAVQAGQVLNDEQWNALPKDKYGRIYKEAFRYDAERNVYICPTGDTLPRDGSGRKARKWGQAVCQRYRGIACAGCERAGSCCRDPAKGRTVTRDQYEPQRERMRERMKSAEGQQHYRLRSQTVEPRFGHIKRGLGVRRFLRRGLEKVRTEWRLICTVVNIGVLLKHWGKVSVVL